MTTFKTARPLLTGLLLATCATFGQAQDKVLNLYSARHYQTDEALYANFTKATGIRIERIDADDAGVLTRLKSEGAASPADVVLLVDAARLWKAESEGLFQPVRSAVLESRIPAALRGRDSGQGSSWFGFSTRARVVVYNKATVKQGRRRHLRRAGRHQEQGAGSARAPDRIPTTSRCSARSSSATDRKRPKPGCRAWSPTWAGRPRAATPTRSRRWRPASARSR